MGRILKGIFVRGARETETLFVLIVIDRGAGVFLSLRSQARTEVGRFKGAFLSTSKAKQLERTRPYLNRICSTGSYLCILAHKGDRTPNLVDEPWPCDQSVINGLVVSVRVTEL
ncbi:hypothetical protein CFP56_023825 [Quercus suber]|uniref:Uncharacterized protein n=1 Tax=Quercus suber TaxID=58331 RepID=A0AAW0K831_QUESU